MKNKWWLDFVLFIGFILAFILDLTGLELHQWLGVFVGGFAAYHLITRWSWVEAVSQRFLGETSSQARSFFLFDAGLFVGFTMILVTGLLISTWLDLSLASNAEWLVVHIFASILTLAVLLVKLVWHRRWIATATRSVFDDAPAPTSGSPVPVRASNPRPTSRRQFLQVIGVISAASIVALASALDGLHDAEAAASQAVEGEASESATTVNSSQSNWVQSNSGSSSYTDDCSVRCPRGCSFPGQCRRYRDSNDNNLCDLGECV